jgi:hypothetical protein
MIKLVVFLLMPTCFCATLRLSQRQIRSVTPNTTGQFEVAVYNMRSQENVALASLIDHRVFVIVVDKVTGGEEHNRRRAWARRLAHSAELPLSCRSRPSPSLRTITPSSIHQLHLFP